MKGFWKIVLATVVGMIIVSIISIIITLMLVAGASKSTNVESIKPNSVLSLNFDCVMYDKAPSVSKFKFFDKSQEIIGLNTVLDAIENAKTDDNIKGIYLETMSVGGGVAMADEIRDALLDFKKDAPEKFVVAYAKTMTVGAYFLATACDKIYINPEGNLDFRGLQAQLMFYKKMLDKLGIEYQVFRPEGCKFKSAVEPVITDKMSEANRMQVSRYMNNIWDEMLKSISASRNIPVDKLNNMADELSVTNAKEAATLGLIDATAHRDEVMDYIVKAMNVENVDDMNMVNVSDYKQVAKMNASTSKDKVAVIYAQGKIIDGKGSEIKIGDETLVKSIKEARKDSSVKAVVLRVNSPGGSALASEVILREIVLTKQVKPVIASFSSMAASGGYYISCLSDEIICSPYCLTGSIGVFAMIPNAQKFINEKLGITTDEVSTNKNSQYITPFEKMTDGNVNFWTAQVSDIYNTFISHVADGRGMTTAEVDSIGQGRVWTGTDAINIGLVDQLGGLKKSIQVAAAKANLEDYAVLSLPREKTPYEYFMELMNAKSEAIFNPDNLGILFGYYSTMKDISEMEGVQARVPFEMVVNY